MRIGPALPALLNSIIFDMDLYSVFVKLFIRLFFDMIICCEKQDFLRGGSSRFFDISQQILIDIVQKQLRLYFNIIISPGSLNRNIRIIRQRKLQSVFGIRMQHGINHLLQHVVIPYALPVFPKNQAVPDSDRHLTGI